MTGVFVVVLLVGTRAVFWVIGGFATVWFRPRWRSSPRGGAVLVPVVRPARLEVDHAQDLARRHQGKAQVGALVRNAQGTVTGGGGLPPPAALARAWKARQFKAS